MRQEETGNGVFFTGDQSVLWDAPLKIALLAGMGHSIVHSVHDSDCFSRPPADMESSRPALAKLAYLPDGNLTQWTPMMKMPLMLGRMQIHPREFIERGVDFNTIMWLQKSPLEKVIRRFTEGDWYGISHPDSDMVAHGMKVSEVVGEIPAMRRMFYRNLEESVDRGYRDAALQSFNRLFSRLHDGNEVTWDDASVESLKEYLSEKGVSSAVTVSTTVRELSVSSEKTTSRFFPLFVKHYQAARDAYNEAVLTKGESITPLKNGELPFYAVVRNRAGKVMRVALHHELGGDARSIIRKAEGEHGKVLAIVGKALPHLIELCMRGPLVLPDGGSPYAVKAIKFGILFEEKTHCSLSLNPIYRLYVRALDALEDVHERFLLPEYLRGAFGTQDGWIKGVDFARRWQDVAERARRDADELSGQASKLLPLLQRQQLFSQETAEIMRNIHERQLSFAARHRECLNAYEQRIAGAVKAERAALLGERGRKISEIEDEFDLESLNHLRKMHNAILEEKRAKALREKLAIAISLSYWNRRPVSHWIDAIPGWYEAVKKRAELILDPEFTMRKV